MMDYRTIENSQVIEPDYYDEEIIDSDDDTSEISDS